MSTPNIRFKQNNGDKFPDWKEIKIRNLGEFRRGQTYSRNQTTLDENATFIVRSSNLIDSWFIDFSKNKQFANIKIQNDDLLQLGDVVICTANGSTSLVGKSSIYNGKYAGSISWGAFCSVFRSNKDAPLAKYFFRTHRYRKLINFMKQGGNGALGNLNVREISNTSILFPCTEEQQKIASFFSTLDQKIELNERKLEALEKLKKELMHQIFNRKIRFKEKDGTEFPEWASSTLGNEVQFAKGGKLGKKDLRENGAFPCLLYGELYTFYKCIASTIISRTNIPSDNRSKKNDVVIPTSGETAEDIATATCIPHDGVLYGGDLLILRSKSLYGPFLSYLINSSLKRKISRLAQGKSVVHIGADKIKNIEFQFPCTKEQQKIANFLSSFDQKIDVIEKRIEAMRKLKFGFMQQMFV